MGDFFTKKTDKFTFLDGEGRGYELKHFEIKKVSRSTMKEQGMTVKNPDYENNPMIVWELHCEEENETYTIRQMLFIKKGKDGGEYTSSPLNGGFQKQDGTFTTPSTAYEIFDAIVRTSGNESLRGELLKLGWQDESFWVGRKFEFLAKCGISKTMQPYCILATEYQKKKDTQYSAPARNETPFDLDAVEKGIELQKNPTEVVDDGVPKATDEDYDKFLGANEPPVAKAPFDD